MDTLKKRCGIRAYFKLPAFLNVWVDFIENIPLVQPLRFLHPTLRLNRGVRRDGGVYQDVEWPQDLDTPPANDLYICIFAIW